MPIIVGTSGPDTVDGTAGNDLLYGLEDNDTLNGLAGNDYLDGGAGNDILNGGADDDVYIVDALGDVVNESAGQGFDIVYAIASYVLATGVQVERLSSTDHLSTVAKDLTGNDYVTDIYGNNGANVLTGGAANNLLLGFGGSDTLNGLGGQDALLGMDGDDILNGGAGNDYFEGGAGSDVLNGGADDDIFIVDNTDTVGELTGEGFDIVYATTSYVLAAGAYVERLSSTDHLSTTAKNLTGNDLVPEILGNNGVNVLTGGTNNNIILGFGGGDTLNGLAGNDSLYGMDGGDTLNGGADNDYFDGGAGNDTANGGAGDDVYLVDSGDTVVEIPNDGFDIVYATANYVLSALAHVEVLFAANTASTDARNLTGNDHVWEIYGNNGVNTLTGGGGASSLFGLGGDDILNGLGGNDFLYGGAGTDRMDGGTGDDTFFVEQSQDIAAEDTNEGNDVVYSYVDYRLPEGSSIEMLAAIDSGADNDIRLFGNSAGNTISGDIGDNLLDTGLGGTDTLVGLAGADIFNFRNMSQPLGSSRALALGVATIQDFVQGTDLIRLDSTKFATLLGGGSGMFEIGATATSASTRLLYDPATGNLIYDTDGNSSDVSADPGAIFGRIQTGLTLTLGDFIIEANQAPDVNDDSYAMTVGATDSTIEIDMKANDFDVDGLRLWVTKIGVDSGSLINITTGLSPTFINGTYGRISGGAKGNEFTYRLDVDDADTVAIAPGTTVTETFVYEVTDGMLEGPNLGQLASYALSGQATITITISRSASGALMSQVSASDALAPPAPPADDHAAFASVSDAAFAPVGGGEDYAAGPNMREAGDYLVADLWMA